MEFLLLESSTAYAKGSISLCMHIHFGILKYNLNESKKNMITGQLSCLKDEWSIESCDQGLMQSNFLSHVIQIKLN